MSVLRYVFGCILPIFVIGFVNVLAAQDSVVVHTDLGAVKGMKEGECWVFKGVPYAEKLTDATRFNPPQLKLGWADTLDCRQFGDRAPQYGNSANVVKGSLNCLSLNIYTATCNAKAKKPVLVWVHGGGMTNGQGADMDGHAFADQDSVVTVTMNYRLGVLGFLYLEDVKKGVSGNNGLLDLITALQYIRKNISAYGGDANRISVMGESAGAKLASTLLLTMQSKDLFRQLILESGAIQCVRDIATAKSMRQRLLDTLQIKDPKMLLTMPLEKLVDAQNKVCGGAQGTNYFGPVADGSVIPIDFVRLLEKRDLRGQRFLLGSNKAESRLFMNMDRRLYRPDVHVLSDWFGKNGSIIDSAVLHSGKDSVTGLLTEYMYAMHTHRLVNMLAKKQVPTWLYRFDYDAKGEGATHAQELAYVWYRKSADKHVANEPLAENVHQQWVRFIKGNVPEENWKTFSRNRIMKVIGDASSYIDNPIFYEDARFPIGCFRL
ncbi:MULTISPECIES: carboxylesterase/lipase family protein [Chitinophagaceae]